MLWKLNAQQLYVNFLFYGQSVYVKGLKLDQSDTSNIILVHKM